MTPSLTILAVPKAFAGHIGVIQRNAISSWTVLSPRPDIRLYGTEDGIAEAAASLGVSHETQIACNEFGTPMLDDLLRRARGFVQTPLLCYVNSDIILLQEFLDAVAARDAVVPIDHIYGFDQIAEAHAAMEADHASGKLVVTT